MANTIPITSFQPFLTGDTAAQRDVAKQIYDAFCTVGFIYIKDHGIPPSSVQSIFNESARFFSMPKSTKMTYALTDPSLNQGYTAEGAEGIGDHKECYEHRRFANPHCPDDAALPEFKSQVDTFYAHCYDLAMNVLRCLAIAMNLGPEFFTTITKHADPQLRLLHYPSIPLSTLDDPTQSRISPHTDFGLCTLLFQDNIGGLEVDPFHTGEYKPAPPVDGTVLVNIGDLMQRYTNGRCKSTLHRVKAPQHLTGSDGMLPARFSIPFFVHPDPETVIDPILLEPGEVRKYKPVVAKEWRDYNTKRNYGLGGTKKTSLSRGDGDYEIT